MGDLALGEGDYFAKNFHTSNSRQHDKTCAVSKFILYYCQKLCLMHTQCTTLKATQHEWRIQQLAWALCYLW